MSELPRPTAVIYLRQSLDSTGEGLAVTRQLEDCRKLATMRGWDVQHVIEDNSVSASTGTRGGFEQLMQLVEDGQVKVIITWALDRLTRKLTDLERLIELASQGVTIATVTGDLDLSTDTGRLLGRILASVARAEVERKSARQKRSNKQRAEKGLPHKARRAYGYEPNGMAIIEHEAELLRDMAGKLLSGWSVREIATWLNDEGHPTTTGKKFTIKVVKDHLTSKRNTGIRFYDGAEYEAVWPAVFSRDLHERILSELVSRNRSPRTKARKYLLTGILECGRCGHALLGHARRDGPGKPIRPKYECPQKPDRSTCNRTSRAGTPMDHFIKEAVIYRLDTPDLAKMLQDRQDHALELGPLIDHQKVVQGRMDVLLDDYTDGTLTKPEYQRAKQRLADELQTVTDRIMDLYAGPATGRLIDAGETLHEAWERQSLGWRRQLITLLVKKIIVHPSQNLPDYYIDGERFRFDYNSVEIVWRV